MGGPDDFHLSAIRENAVLHLSAIRENDPP